MGQSWKNEDKAVCVNSTLVKTDNCASLPLLATDYSKGNFLLILRPIVCLCRVSALTINHVYTSLTSSKDRDK